MAGNWTLDTFTVVTSTESRDQDFVYANGKMQVLVVVTVAAVNDDNTPHIWTDDEFTNLNLKLIDYDDPASDLSNGWSYSTTENVFDHTIGSTSAVVINATIDTSPNKQRYWVSTTETESKNIGASVKVLDGSIVNTSGRTFDSRVNITGKPPRDIHFEDLSLRQDTNTANGNIGNTYTYDQDNYYLTVSDNRRVRLLDCFSFDGGSTDPYLKYSFGLFSNDMPCYIWYWWPVGTEKQVDAGCKDVHISITINQQKDSACFTRLLINDGPNIWNKHYTWGSKFTVYDEYGNSCDFYPDWTDAWNTLKISEDKP
ncbi:hypothetical protein TrVFT333_010768 [Trichoderma virens FT-333]|nr:hypothetical protein TrVFT333_010768 [Trichoderma virens FT-333]